MKLTFLCRRLIYLALIANVTFGVEVKVTKTKPKKNGDVLMKAKCIYKVKEEIATATFNISMDTDISKFKSNRVTVLTGSGSEYHVTNVKTIKAGRFIVAFQGVYRGDADTPVPTGSCSNLEVPTTTSTPMTTSATTTASQTNFPYSFPATMLSSWAIEGTDNTRFSASCELAVDASRETGTEFLNITTGVDVEDFQHYTGSIIEPVDCIGSWFHLTNEYNVQPPKAEYGFQATHKNSDTPTVICHSTLPAYSASTVKTTTPLSTTSTAAPTPTTSPTTTGGDVGVPLESTCVWQEGDNVRIEGKCEFSVTKDFPVNDFKIKLELSSPTFEYYDWSWDMIDESTNGRWYYVSNTEALTTPTVTYTFQLSASGTAPPTGRCFADGGGGVTLTTEMTTAGTTTSEMTTAATAGTTKSDDTGVPLDATCIWQEGDNVRIEAQCEFSVTKDFPVNDFKIKLELSSPTFQYTDWSWDMLDESTNGRWYYVSNTETLTTPTVTYTFQLSASGTAPPTGRCFADGGGGVTLTTEMTTAGTTTSEMTTAATAGTTKSDDVGVPLDATCIWQEGENVRIEAQCEFSVDKDFPVNDFKIKLELSTPTFQYTDWSWDMIDESTNGRWYYVSNTEALTTPTVTYTFQLSASGTAPPTGRCFADGGGGVTLTTEMTTAGTTTSEMTTVATAGTTKSDGTGVPLDATCIWQEGENVRIEAQCEFSVTKDYPVNDFKIKLELSTTTFQYTDWSWDMLDESTNGRWYYVSNTEALTTPTVTYTFQLSASGTAPPTGRCFADGGGGVTLTTEMTTAGTTTSETTTAATAGTTKSDDTGVPLDATCIWQEGENVRIEAQCEFSVTKDFPVNDFKIRLELSTPTFQYTDWSWDMIDESTNGRWYYVSNTEALTTPTVTYTFQLSASGTAPPTGRCFADGGGGVTLTTEMTTADTTTSEMTTAATAGTTKSDDTGVPLESTCIWQEGVNVRIEAQCEFSVTQDFPVNDFKIRLELSSPTLQYTDWSWDMIDESTNGRWYYVSNTEALTTPTVTYTFQLSASGTAPPTGRCFADGGGGVTLTTEMTTAGTTTSEMTTAATAGTTKSDDTGVPLDATCICQEGENVHIEAQCEFSVTKDFPVNDFKIKLELSAPTFQYTDWSWDMIDESTNGRWYYVSNTEALTTPTVTYTFQLSASGTAPPTGRCFADGGGGVTLTTEMTTADTTTSEMTTAATAGTTKSDDTGVPLDATCIWQEGENVRIEAQCEFSVTQDFPVNDFKIKLELSSPTFQYTDWSWDMIDESTNGRWYYVSNTEALTTPTVTYTFQLSASGTAPPTGRCFADGGGGVTLTTEMTTTSTSSTTSGNDVGVPLDATCIWQEGENVRIEGQCEFDLTKDYPVNDFNVKLELSSPTFDYYDWKWNTTDESANGRWYYVSNTEALTTPTVIYTFQLSASGTAPPTGRCVVDT